MKNWSIDTTHFKKDLSKYVIWKLEQLINFGLDGEKIDREELKSNLPYLNLDPSKRKFIEYLLTNA